MTDAAIQAAMETVRPPFPYLAVVCHRMSDAAEDGPLHTFDLQIAEGGSSYVFKLWILIPASFVGSDVALVFWGYPSFPLQRANLSIRDRWQQISVTTTVPEFEIRLTPSLIATASPDAYLFSAGWRIERDGPQQRPVKPVVLRSYEIVSLDEIIRRDLRDIRDEPIARRLPCLPDIEVAIPQISYGQIEEPPGITQWPPNNWKVASYRVQNADMYILRNAIVHGDQGIITVDNLLVEESLYMAHPDLQGFYRTDTNRMALSTVEPDVWVDTASHLLCGYVGGRNYAHWWVDVVPALLVPPFHKAFDGTTLIWPPVRTTWQAQTLELLPEVRGRSLFTGEFTRIGCRELRLVPKITESDMRPHPFRHRLLGELKRRVGHDGSVWRKIYLSRRDAGARRLLNEDNVATLLEQNGFETVVLTGMAVADQIALFASASHVIAPHGAGLANLLFCSPGAALCEFHMSSNVQWSIRRIAAVTGMRYGCIIGKAEDETAEVHLRDWRIDLDDLRTILRDPRFTSAV